MNRSLERLYNRVQNVFQRGRHISANDIGDVQLVQVRLGDGELADGVENLQAYGLTSNAHEGAEHLTVFRGGSRDSPLVILVGDRRYRLHPLKTGDVALYSSGENYVIMRASGDIEIHTPKNLVMSADGDISVNAGGKIDIASGGDTTIVTGGKLYLN
ncbi:MAG: hypothetical protein COA62_15645 [Rhodobiaceae bacterium]|nr:MAG: hypothetical protein COA62_15645 [Rhodobiaceae bacterium]